MISNQDKEARDASQSQSTLSEDDLMQLLSNIDNLSYTEIDSKIRSFIFSSNETTLEHIFPLILPHIDINFQSESDNNTTLLMQLVSKGLNTFAESLIDKSTKSIDTAIKDNMNENVMFKIIKSPNEQCKLSLFKKVLHATKENLTCNNEVDIINEINNESYSLLALSLLIGNSDICSLLLVNGSNPSIANSITGDNILHCAVKGKNPYCLNLILNKVESSVINKLINSSNKNNETPVQLAMKMNLSPMIKLLNDTLTLLKNNDINNEITIENSQSPTDLLCCVNKENIDTVIDMIQQYYMNDWNKIFVEHFIAVEKDKKYNFDLLAKVMEFFLKESEESNEKLRYTNEKELYFLNYMISTFRCCDYQKMLDIFMRYLRRENKKKEDFVFYVNSSLMFIDLSIKLNLNNVGKFLLKKLDENIKSYYESSALNDKDNLLSNKKMIKYLNHINLFTPNLYQKDNGASFNYNILFQLYLCFINVNQNNYDSAKKILAEVKQSISNVIKNTSNKKGNIAEMNNYTNILKNFYKILKVRIDYFNNTQFKFYKHLNSLISFSSSINQSHLSSSLSLHSTLFYYNSIGILNLKEKKYSYAEYCFKHCESLIHQNEISTNKYMSNVLYNISLCYFFTKKYEKCYKILSSLKNMDTFANNPYLFYRLGLCCIERELQDAKINSQSENVNDIVNKIINDPSENENSSRAKRILLVNSSVNGNSDEDANKNITEAINSFKQCLLIIKGYSIYVKDFHNAFEKYEYENDNTITQYSTIIPSVYLNLIFCLLRNEDYNEAISIAKDFEAYSNSKNYQYIINNYLVEAYLRMNEHIKAAELVSENNFSFADLKGTFYTENNMLLYNDVSFKLALYVNLVKINLLNGKEEEAKRIIGVILGMVKGSKEIPPFVINVIVYYLITTKQDELAIKTIKFRKVPKMFEM